MAFVAPQGNKTVMVDNNNNIVYPASFQKVVATQATIAGNNFTDVPSVIDPENATTTQLPSVASVVNYVADVVEGGSSGLIPAIQSDIQTLGQVKSNRGVFHFINGTLTCSQLQDVPVSFSMCRRFAFTKAFWDSIDTSTKDFYFDGSFDGYKGASFCKGKSKKLGIGYGTGSGQWWAMIDLDETNSLMDGNVHSLVGIGANDKLSVYVDNKLYAETSIQSSSFTPDRVNQIVDISGLYFDIYNFNFDISDANAPYTIADYISGKDESPLLNLGVQSYNASDMTFTSVNQTSYPCELVSDSTTDTITITTTGEISAEYVWIDGRANAIAIPQGANVEVSVGNLDVATSVQGYFYSGATRVQTLTGVSNDNPTISFIAPANLTRLSLIVHTGVKPIPTGTILTITGLKIKVNGALLSLADYSIKVGATKIVPDVSGNNNDATITGVVIGSKDTSIAKMAQLFYQSQQG